MDAPGDRVFSGSIPQMYERFMVPLIFEPYALDLARRAVSLPAAAVLEIAAGTGAVTRKLADQLPADVSIVATDLNQAMIDQAQSIGTSRAVTWRQADAMSLPFADGSFDLVVCQFGCMFLPDKAAGYSEMRRVLRPGGTLLFNVWDRIEDNEFADTVTQALAGVFPDDPPRFLARLPHGYHDRAVIAADLVRGGFAGPNAIDTLAFQSRAPSPEVVAIAFCQGTPLRGEIEARDAKALERATQVAYAALQQRHGAGEVSAKIQAHVIAARRVA